ncbi:hypothetical protein SOVF_200770 [Spinacia oleracea]|nr:hypothetical protein SOVF_200770 [Spinacia oleracea]
MFTVSPLSKILTPSIFAGYNKTLRVFDVHRRGGDFKQHSTLQGSKERAVWFHELKATQFLLISSCLLYQAFPWQCWKLS